MRFREAGERETESGIALPFVTLRRRALLHKSGVQLDSRAEKQYVALEGGKPEAGADVGQG